VYVAKAVLMEPGDIVVVCNVLAQFLAVVARLEPEQGA
jgi:hypothetical protein